MKMKGLHIAVALLAATCAAPKHNNNMKNERITYFSYGHHNSMSLTGEQYDVTTTDDHRVHVVLDQGSPGEREFYVADTAIFDSLLAIVQTYRMDHYKHNYRTRMQIFDGDSWQLSYRYDSRRSVSSGGYMAWPKNYHQMRQALADYFQQWRRRQDFLVMDYFKFTCNNRHGTDQEFTLERGDQQALMTLHDAQRGIDTSLNVSNDVIQQLQQRANGAQLKSTLYDYHTDDTAATRCTYFVRYNTGDTISGFTCHTQYPSHKVTAILDFFSQWIDE